MSTLGNQFLLHKLLQRASKMYYEGTPIMSDEEFDSLSETVGWDHVGYSVEQGPSVDHTFRLYSLQKHYEEDGVDPLSSYRGMTITTPKLDGASVAVTYSEGVLLQVLTRGDGKVGIDITEKFIAKKLIPIKIEHYGLLQLTGEVVSPKSITNSRNYASGSLNLKSISEFISRELSFIVHGCYPFLEETFSGDMRNIGDKGFRTILESTYDEFPQDGKVCRIDNNTLYEAEGTTSHHPKGSFALKERKKGVETTLLDVIWQTGKSGVVSPVGILDPVYIDGAKISRATLHNIGYINSLNLEIGCTVEVIRSGDIIPRITRRIEK